MTVLAHHNARKVDQYLDQHHAEFTQLGKQLFDAFDYDKKKDRISSQIRNLQQVACSAARFADIEDFVKNQMGKTGNREWKQIGESVLQQLSQLRTDSATLAEDVEEQMTVRLKLARGWVRAVVSEYLYQVARSQMGDPS
ncbi:MAG: hypothetical protein WD049_05530 [Candidatus Paceibacterota bacterium]